MFVLYRVIFDGFGQKIFGLWIGSRAPMFVILTVVSYSSPIILGKIREVFFPGDKQEWLPVCTQPKIQVWSDRILLCRVAPSGYCGCSSIK